MDDRIDIAPEVREAIAAGRAVALETSVVAQGLPAPHNLESALRCAAAVRAGGGVPAAIALVGGRVVVGASEAQLARLAEASRKPAKAGVRDLAALLFAGRDAGTTVSATCAIAARVGIRVFATGGIGGVHRRARAGEPLDVSSDLQALAQHPVCVVCAGPKAILDLPATAELLETLAVPVVGFRTSQLPAFYSDESGLALEHRAETAAQLAQVLRLHWNALGEATGVLVCVPPPQALPRAEVEAAIAGALREAAAQELSGKATTPFLLAAVARATAGRSLLANLALLEHNARIAGELASALAALDSLDSKEGGPRP